MRKVIHTLAGDVPEAGRRSEFFELSRGVAKIASPPAMEQKGLSKVIHTICTGLGTPNAALRFLVHEHFALVKNLKRDIRGLAGLVEGAAMPEAGQLPDGWGGPCAAKREG